MWRYMPAKTTAADTVRPFAWLASSSEQGRGRLDLLAFDLFHDLRELGMGRGRDADVVAALGDVAVHELDLGAAPLTDVLRHRRPLDVGPRVRVGVRTGPHDGLDLVQRRLVALGGLGQGL